MRPALSTTLSGFFPSPATLLQQLVDRLVEADGRYREARKFEDLSDERLRDMGLTRPAAVRSLQYRKPWD